MNLLDKRHSLEKHHLKSYHKRAKRSIRTIAIHHSGTISGSAEAFARYHVNELDWPGIGYHYVIDKAGQVSLCNDLEVISYHVGKSNRSAVGICLIGDFRTETFGGAQQDAALQLLGRLMVELSIPLTQVWGHAEYPGYAWKPCPSINMEWFRKLLSNEKRVVRAGLLGVSSFHDVENDERKRRVLRFAQPMMRGDDVRKVQEKVGAKVDGIYGPETRQKVRKFQRNEQLFVDGIVGPETWRRLLKT
ncbi:peptidoglycan recognition protein family protein [Halalkalibacterium ligniniphilum]|uniref:peptidoglycan recognition protein family protein n=1 Tax=Halalkalibacterium ligniniphilum TaxID=1134413 RepID=UPI000345D0A2|nr:N-acetylmuramoyl-L-alanine amidase [Halalkalibacterium ligniniphilum]